MTASAFPASALAALLLCGAVVSAAPDRSGCDAPARTTAGWVCGKRRCDGAGGEYASFRGVPYAKQPLGELRFQELQPPEPWTDVLNATTEGPVCPQTDVVYKGLQTHAGGMSEACIHANIHVPLEALPSLATRHDNTKGLPIFVFVHGGGFAFGSGDADLHGPEYLVSKGVIVITFNYRLNVFGFLSLNSASIPGNNGLRDCVTLLRWVRDNARYFGGNPDQVTLAGQSAGAAMAHLLTLSPAAKGLFQKAVLLSGVGNAEFFSTSPAFAKAAAGLLLAQLGIEPATADDVHRRLVATPIDDIVRAHATLLDLFGLSVFAPVVESPHSGVTSILEDDPDVLLERGCGDDIPLIIGFTSSECETFRPRLTDIDIESKMATTPALLVPAKLMYQTAPERVPALLKLIEGRYFNKSRTLDDFIAYCSDAYYKSPAVRLASQRTGALAATYLYRFAWRGRPGALRPALRLRLRYGGAGHVEDLTYVFRATAALAPLGDAPRVDDEEVADRMTDYIVNFMRYSDPTPAGSPPPRWPTAQSPRLLLQDIAGPDDVTPRPVCPRLRDTVTFFDSLHRISQGQ